VYTATVPMPNLRQVVNTRRAISPRLATKTRVIIGVLRDAEREVLFEFSAKCQA
jgi:hypothetical protein